VISAEQGNILETAAEAVVNPVNCVGVMGRGLALAIRQAYPANYVAYREACARGDVRVGGMFTYDRGATAGNPRYVVNFPTKQDLRRKSRIEWIESGLIALVAEVRRLEITSIAVPALGCGLGGLNWADVRPFVDRECLCAAARCPGVIVRPAIVTVGQIGSRSCRLAFGLSHSAREKRR
jgi:O-acetyl-ADP-ribose deacetylase (regulator of RNase III)